MDYNLQKQLEQTNLNNILSKLNFSKQVLENLINKQGENTLLQLKAFRESPDSGELFFFLDQLQQQGSSFNLADKFLRYEEINYLLKNPYFARIDLFNYNDQKEYQIYIGKFGYTEDMPIITDWRAKVSSVYYRFRYPQKNITYDTPKGTEHADLLLKRTFEIDNGVILKIYNNDLQLDENEIIRDKIQKRTGGVLEDIIETIQQSQLDIIESDPRQVTIVQGAVGSGKSTVAIHKLAHIFFNYPNIIKSNKSIIVAKNSILVNYLSTLFPKLGIFDVTYKTLRDLVTNLYFKEKFLVTYDLNLNTDTSKFDLKLKKFIDNFIFELHKEYKNKIEDVFKNPEFENYGGYRYSFEISILENIEDIISDLQEEYKSQLDLYKENENSTNSWYFKENIRILRKIIYKISNFKDSLKNKTLNDVLNNFINTKDKLGYYETLFYIYLTSKILGIKETLKYDYCVVDEGQDFSILEYSILSLFVTKGRFAIFGDLNQSIIENSVTSWEDISEVIIEAKQAKVFTLDTNYRSTKPIVDLANKVISGFSNKYLPKSINRKGPSPKIKNFLNIKDLISHFKEEIISDLKDLNKSIGIIVYNNEIFDQISSIIKENKNENINFIILDKNFKIQYEPKAVYLTMLEDCKGLEFFKVYILDLNLDKISTHQDAKKAFVAITRAMNEIVILGRL